MTRHQSDSYDAYQVIGNAPVFEVSFDKFTTYFNGGYLPNISITRPIFDEGGHYVGRVYETAYPYSDPDKFLEYDDDEDDDGDDALYYGGCYYEEGMDCTDPADHDRRVDCFRAAELLYRHSAGRGNAVASMCLGYVYSYDRCEGNYWVDPLTKDASDDAQPYPREERAFECLSIAAEAGICEACYKLGDMYRHGTGCAPDAEKAFHWYVRASELAQREPPVILGSVALRLGDCYEEGFGCGQDFRKALGWYEKAEAGLDFAVENGETWYAKALAGARAGVKRCRQELPPPM